ncbi:hypothetical protein [Dongshaea marina]|uniref:hypothetical protein n=1 Tax=Dongshaea marina TaxID=2047966 RepID=UPI000D3E4874|nr:hypothetical protein [Dongshaea marina]
MVDSGKELDTLAAQVKYKEAIDAGKTCINADSGAYIDPSLGQNNNCLTSPEEDQYYFSWNNAHYTSEVNMELAHYISQQAALGG